VKNRYTVAFDLFRISRLWHLFSCDLPLFATPSSHRLITNPLFSCYQFRSNPKARHDHGSQSCVKCNFIFMNCNNITMIVARAQRNFIIIIMRNSTVIDQIMINYFLILNCTSAKQISMTTWKNMNVIKTARSAKEDGLASPLCLKKDCCTLGHISTSFCSSRLFLNNNSKGTNFCSPGHAFCRHIIRSYRRSCHQWCGYTKISNH
jgi:hypothetical protein